PGAGWRGLRRAVRLQVAVEPAVGRALYAGRGRFHVILSVEMRARVVGRACGMNDRELARIVDRFERRKSGMEGEESVEINRRRLVRLRPSSAGARNRDRRTQVVILLLGVWDNCAQPVHLAALKDGDQYLPAPFCIRLSQRARQERRGHRRGADAGQRDATVFQKKSSVHHNLLSWLVAGGWLMIETNYQPPVTNHLFSLPLKFRRSQNQSDDLRHVHLAAGHRQAPLAQALVNRLARLRPNLAAQ